MAAKKEHNYVQADGKIKEDAEKIKTEYKKANAVGNSVPLRIGAVCCWVLALLCEIFALRAFQGYPLLKSGLSTNAQMVAFLVIDLILVIVGAQLWKKANHIKPMSEKNKTLFWLWNNLGVVMCAVCFVPFIILVLANKDADGKTKKLALMVAIVACLIGGVASYDFNPVSQEQLTAAENVLGEQTVFWAPHGKVYHTHDDCQALNNTDTLTYGTVAEAVAANRTRLCSFCAKQDDITGVVTDGE